MAVPKDSDGTARVDEPLRQLFDGSQVRCGKAIHESRIIELILNEPTEPFIEVAEHFYLWSTS